MFSNLHRTLTLVTVSKFLVKLAVNFLLSMQASFINLKQHSARSVKVKLIKLIVSCNAFSNTIPFVT